VPGLPGTGGPVVETAGGMMPAFGNELISGSGGN
jgi:hypothetical protein